MNIHSFKKIFDGYYEDIVKNNPDQEKCEINFFLAKDKNLKSFKPLEIADAIWIGATYSLNNDMAYPTGVIINLKQGDG